MDDPLQNGHQCVRPLIPQENTSLPFTALKHFSFTVSILHPSPVALPLALLGVAWRDPQHHTAGGGCSLGAWFRSAAV